MNIQTYIQQVGIEKASSALGVSIPAIKHYRNGIRKVSPSKVLATCKATGWTVTPHELRPDLYPNPTDGLPAGEAAHLIASGAIKPISSGRHTQFSGGGCLYSAAEEERRRKERRLTERRDHERREDERRQAS